MSPKQQIHISDESRLIHARLADRETEIALLKEISDALSSQLNLEKLLDMVAERARSLIDAETLLIPLLDKDCEQYTYRAGCGKNSDEIVGESLPIDFGVCGWVWKHKRAWWQGVLDELSETERNKWEKEAGSLILVPLIGKNHFLGGIAGINKSIGGDFDKRDLDLLSIFASQVSIAIENATSYDKIERQKQKAEEYQAELAELNARLLTANKELETLALRDPLTGIANRSLLHDRLEQTLRQARRNETSASIIIVDLNHFKDINDTLGHDTGDKLLRLVSDRLSRLIRETDTIGRLGGDEFGIIMPETTSSEAFDFCQSIATSLLDSIQFGEQRLSIGASFGVASYPEHGDDIHELLKRSDIAMYLAKKTMQHCAIYDPEKDVHSPERLNLMSDIREAVVENQFELYYQPKINIADGMITGVEALARWPGSASKHAPDLFIPIMEQTSLIYRFSEWVVETAIKQSIEWSRNNYSLEVSVNLSAFNLRDPEFTDLVLSLIKTAGFDPRNLVFEITESAVMGDHRQIACTIENLMSHGVRFSIDDFGTGYSSLTHLKNLNVSELKIDKSFVTSMIDNPDDEVIVKSIIDLGRNLGLKTVAEGVETESILNRLRELKCDMYQGFLVSPAVTAGEIEQLLSR